MGPQDTRFSREMMWLMSWSDGEHCSKSLQSFVVSLLSSLVFISFFKWRCTVSSSRFSQSLLKNLYFLIMFNVYSLVVTATDTVFIQALISLVLAKL